MPVVAPVPGGQNLTMIRGLSERTRSVEARRNRLGLSIQGSPYSVLAAAGWAHPVSWPSLQVNVGSSGAVWVIFGAADSGSSCKLGVGVDGSSPSQATGFSQSGAFNSGCFGGINGLVAGWHTLTLWNEGNGANMTASLPWLIGWAL